MNLTFRSMVGFILAVNIGRSAAPAACYINSAADLHITDHPSATTDLNWLQKAADDGDPCAQFQLGRLYQLGDGVPKDTGISRAWYRKAADQGLAEAQNNLGLLYYDDGVPQHKRASASWYRKAADQGYVEAQLRLGNMYFNGDGVLQDYVLAHMWYNLAAAAGDVLSGDAATNRDFVTEKMTPAQIAEAQRLAHEWKAASVQR
jgi:TPR repeat protein